MTSMKELIELGKEFGYEGEELKKFVQDEQAKEREQRLRDREFEREKEEKEVKLLERQREFEREKEQKVLELLERQKEAEREKEEKEVKLLEQQRLLEREKEELRDREHRRALELVQVEHQQAMELAKQGVGKSFIKDHKIKGPKLPWFDEDKDNMDSYLSRFERYAEAQGWKNDQWSLHLSALLKGKALDVYSRLPAEDALDYIKLKSALLQRFELTEEGFRKRFKVARPETGETFVQYLRRSMNYLERWLELGKIVKSYEGVIDFLLRDQLLSICNKDLYLFLKEKMFTDGNEMAVQADLFAEARGGCRNVVLSGNNKEKDQVARGFRSDTGQRQGSSTQKAGNSFTNWKCSYCGGNHRSDDCRKRGSRHSMAAVDDTGGRFTSGDTRNASTGPFERYSHNQGNQYFKGRGKPRGLYRGGLKRTASSSCIYLCNDSSEQLGACMERNCPTKEGTVNGVRVNMMRDTGATCVVVRKRLVQEHQFLGKERCCKYIDGSEHYFPVAMIEVKTPYYEGTTEALCIDTPLYDLVVGNITGAKYPEPGDVSNAMQTRSQTEQNPKPYRKLHVPGKILDISQAEYRDLQMADETLSKTREKASERTFHNCKGGGQVRYLFKNKLLYREFEFPNRKQSYQLVVPKTCREAVLKIAHESLMAGHLGIRKTRDRALAEFYWPGVCSEVSRYCRSCDICQRTMPKGKVQKVPLGEMPLIETPFKRVAVDLVGPIEPMTDRKNRYILVMVDYATRYPEAVALPGIETERVAEALVDMFSRLGIPEEMLTDMGSQFTSKMMAEVSRLLSLRQLTTTPYHPMCNGLVEKFNGTLKRMIKRMCSERPKDWDKYINAALFAYREVPQESLGFSPFELLYGRTVRGPLSILKELWSGEVNDVEVKLTYQYVIDLRERLEETCKMAQDELSKAKSRQKIYYNKRAKDRSFPIGAKVLVLLPVSHNKLLLQWKGPFEVIKVMNKVDYRINMKGKEKTFHANMLKQYNERSADDGSSDKGILAVVCSAVIEDSEDRKLDNADVDWVDEKIPLECLSRVGNESKKDVDVCKELSPEQREQVDMVLEEFADVLTDIPGTTSLVEHDIKLNTSEPIRFKGYPIPYQSVATVNEEVSKMLELGVIEHSNAPFSSPIVLVRKKDGTVRFCIDFRQLNRVTVFDAEPMPNIEEIFSKVSRAKYFTKIDLSKGYWQVPLTEQAKDMTSFETPKGLFRFNKMPFGLVCAASTFCRLMRKVLKDLDFADSFIDDILVFTVTWEEHITALREIFSRLKVAKLTARPSKCSIGFGNLECLGHVIDRASGLMPVQGKIEALQKAERPISKKQVRSFLGVVGFYRKFIPNFSAIAVPLTDLTKKGQPNKVMWGECQEVAFQTLKKSLVGPPILKLPEFDKSFILRTDASDIGLGAVLLQDSEGEKLPVAYASKKLLDRERNYSVIEKECLGVIWGVSKFHRYLFGKEFILETDHQPLTYLNKSKMANSRLMRWALSLQPYRMSIRAIPGRENVGADYLSRVNSQVKESENS